MPSLSAINNMIRSAIARDRQANPSVSMSAVDAAIAAAVANRATTTELNAAVSNRARLDTAQTFSASQRFSLGTRVPASFIEWSSNAANNRANLVAPASLLALSGGTAYLRMPAWPGDVVAGDCMLVCFAALGAITWDLTLPGEPAVTMAGAGSNATSTMVVNNVQRLLFLAVARVGEKRWQLMQ